MEGDPMSPSGPYDPTKITYSIKEACKASSLAKTTIYGAISANRLKAVRVGGRTLIPADALRAFLLGEA
jgi:excisionase family DNA binding protein